MKKHCFFLIVFLITIISNMAFLFLISSGTAQGLIEAVSNFYPVVNWNITTSRNINGINSMAHFYGLVTSCLFISVLTVYMLRKRKIYAPSYARTAVFVLSVSFIFMTFVQTSFQILSFSRLNNKLAGKTSDEKKYMIFGPAFHLSRLSHERFPGKHKAIFMSDLNVKDHYDQFTRFGLIYNIYPIDISGYTDRETDCLVMFYRTKPSISPELVRQFPVMHAFGKYYGIALKKEFDNGAMD